MYKIKSASVCLQYLKQKGKVQGITLCWHKQLALDRSVLCDQLINILAPIEADANGHYLCLYIKFAGMIDPIRFIFIESKVIFLLCFLLCNGLPRAKSW